MKSYVNQLELSEEGNEVELGLVCIFGTRQQLISYPYDDLIIQLVKMSV